MGRCKRNNLKDLKHESYEILCRCICIEGNADVCKQSAPLGGRGRRITRKNFCPDQCPCGGTSIPQLATNEEVGGWNPSMGTNK